MSVVSNCSKRICFAWTVGRPFQGRPRYSPEFIYHGKRFRLKFCVRWGSYSIYVEPEDAVPGTITVHVEDYVRDTAVKLYYLRHRGQVIWQYSEQNISKEILNFKKRGHLTFIVKFNVDVKLELDSTPGLDVSIQTPPCMDTASCLESLSEDFSQLLDHGQKPDVVLCCGDLKVQAHGIILSTRSKVFAAMLSNDMTENRTGIVEIQDMDREALDHFVKYLYTGKLPDLTVESARRFYEAADKYAVKSLMLRCGSFLTENLDLENAYEMLVLADAHSDVDFKEGVIDYILRKEFHLQQDDRWFAFRSSQPVLASEVLDRFCRSLTENNEAGQSKRRRLE